ncbi:MAG: hypothetical protein GX796_11895 [Clostridiaceae bacterium]|nr:hypothetical protein [Clostridiaceae bacterium]
MPKYFISGLVIEMLAPHWTLHSNLKIFQSNDINIDISCRVVFEKPTMLPNGKKKYIVKTGVTSVYETEDLYYVYDGHEDDIPSVIVASHDWSGCTMYVDPKLNKPNEKETVETVQICIFAALRKVMISALVQRKGFLIHSSTIIWNGKGIVFSAPSGTGKTTHTNLWKQMYHVRILDGDVTACRIIDEVPRVYGLPWCGTSGEFLNESVPLGAIVFLQQDKVNRIEKLNIKEAFIRLTARCYLQPWGDEMTNRHLDNIQEVIDKTSCYLLNCLPDQDAVELVRKCLE